HDDVAQQQLIRRPKHKGNFDASWQLTRAWQVSADVLWVGTWVDGNRDFSIGRLDAPSYTTVNLATSYDINQTFEVFGRLDNLLDRRYQNPIGFQAPGFGVFAGIKVKL